MKLIALICVFSLFLNVVNSRPSNFISPGESQRKSDDENIALKLLQMINGIEREIDAAVDPDVKEEIDTRLTSFGEELLGKSGTFSTLLNIHKHAEGLCAGPDFPECSRNPTKFINEVYRPLYKSYKSIVAELHKVLSKDAVFKKTTEEP